MSSLVSVLIGMVAGIGLIVTFAFYFNQSVGIASPDYNSNLAGIAARANADCINSECAEDIILKCDRGRSALVPYGYLRAWVVQPLQPADDCRIMFTEMPVTNLKSILTDFTVYDCYFTKEELAEMKGNSFFDLLPDRDEKPPRGCCVFVR